MTQPDSSHTSAISFVFPSWANRLPLLSAAAIVSALGLVITLLWYYGSPKHTDVGYSPKQPVPYSHKLHAGDLGIDCRYCHTSVEKSSVASVPPTQTCMNCHAQVKAQSELLKPVRDSFASDIPIPWIRIHKLPDYVYFNHSSHVNRGVACVDCHGRVDQMIQVKQVEPLSMGWCLDCHRNPTGHIRPPVEVTKMDWKPPPGETRESYGKKLMEGHANNDNPINPPTYCSGCHR